MLLDYVIPETPDCLLDETPLAAEIRARATVAASRRSKVEKAQARAAEARAAAAAERAALDARAAHLAVLHPTHSAIYEKASPRKKIRRQIPVKGRATLTGANPGHRITRHPIQLAHSHMLPEAGYVSLQRHDTGCRSDELVAINAYAWADLEIREGDAFYGMDPADVAGIVLARHDAAGVPRPDYVTFSGRGLWFVYLADGRIPPQARGRVLKACRAYWGEEIKTGRGAGTERVTAKAAAMRSLWEGGRIDWAVADMSRVHRIAGSINDASGETVRLVWPASWADVTRSGFDAFCDAVLPFTRQETKAYLDECAARRKAREERAIAEGRTPTGFLRAPMPGRWAVVATEIEALIRHHAGDGAVPPDLGLRNLLGHHLCCAWALSGRGGDARAWAAELAPWLCGPKLSEKALATYLRPIEKALRRHEAGETVTYKPPGGEPREVSPLYEYGVGRVARELKVTRELAASLGFRILTPATQDRQALSPAERQAAKRQRAGARKREAMAKEKRERSGLILELTAEGLDAGQVAELLGCCARTVERALEEMFEGAADRATVVLDLPDEDVSDDQMQALVEACTLTAPTDPSRHLSEGFALKGEPAPAAPREPVPAWIEADVNPDLGRLFGLFVAEYPLPPGQRYSDHAQRLQGLFWHDLARVGRVDRTMRLHVRRDALEFAMHMLQGELEDGISFGRLPTQETVYMPLKPRPRRPVRTLGHCPSPATRLH
ncbi:hypothetical protein GOFOIKOB_0054 [Methylobacterium tardum]|nr:hypothetical protein [Methylobacterium tardum]URD36633.1 hypothetical protein M6G65_30615 [Methylobacterium tardum]GJE47035.1 hypothetical protein GOFOIKOB_0054 [Methylobacterium tardum]